MAHNLSSNQQQHAMVVSSSGQQPMPQRTMIAQRGSPTMAPTKAGYGSGGSMNQYMSQPSPHTAPQLMAYPKQKMADLGQYSNAMGGSMSMQNGTFQSTSVSSLHSTLGFDGGQMSIQQHHHQQQQQPQYLQNPQHQPHHQQQNVHSNSQQYQNSAPHQPVAGQMQWRQEAYGQQNHQHQQPHHNTFQQNSMSTSPSQHVQMQQSYPQRSLNQPRYNQKQHQQNSQPKQLLLSDAEVSVVHFATGSSASATTGHTAVIETNGQPEVDGGDKETKVATSESSETDKRKLENDSPSNASEKPSMANTKEKTPMCLINELARFNKMSHQYTLVDEQGPAHKKTFYVKLKLGDEEYSASGESIKKAQHAAAAIALAETKFQHPAPKPARMDLVDLDKEDGNLTPTVELNALAMKRGEATSYKSIEPQQPPFYHQPGMDYRSLYNHRYHQFMRGGGRDPRFHRGQSMMWPVRYHYPRMNRAFYVSLRVGHREFIGDGPTRQSARHNAAQKALRILKNLPIPNVEKKPEEEEEEENSIDDSLKSEISLVHEIALRRNMSVEFDVIRETGPPHMKNFVTRCKVSHLVTDGEGNSKKLSKKKAAEQMLEELQKLPAVPVPVCPRPKPKNQMNKKKNKNIIKSELQQQKADPNYGVGINPISRLIQIMQAQKKKEPVYTLVAERGLPRRREFIVQVEVEDKTCTGTGPNKKLAKRSAAEGMLQLLGYTKPSPQPTKSSFKNTSDAGQNSGDRKMVTFSDGDSHSGCQSNSSNSQQQRVPGLIHLPAKTSAALAGSMSSSSPSSPSPSGPSTNIKENLVNLSNILQPNLRPEVQLRELCKALAYQLEIDDFTKKRPMGTEHITRITVGSTEVTQSFHGSNNTLESSRDMAALDALKVLLAKVKDVHPAGDGPQMKKDLLIRSSPSSKKDLST